ncbi:hypothetical protein AB0C27_37700 [Nonomuraea sp. NPDC048882]|uniref:hypothetical protein n=1 Tax=unclassified Nonomuraea TaxID=2593643 RepID=UPI000B3271CE
MSELPEETGDERVDAIVARLGGLGELPVSEHVALFDEAFSGLESTLAAVDEPTADQPSPDGRPSPSEPMPDGPMPGGPTPGERPRPGGWLAGERAVGRP